MRACGWVVACVVVAMVVAPAGAQQPAGAMSQNFDTGQLEGWEIFGGASVANVGRGNALVVNNEGFGVWLAATVSNFSMQYSYLPPQEGVAQVMFRMSGEPPNNGEYLLRHEGGQFLLIRHYAEQEQVLASQPVQLAAGQWQNVVISANGGQIQVSVGGQVVLSANDPQPLNPGAVAFGAIFGMGVAYDSITIAPQAGGAVAQPFGGTLQPQPAGTGTATGTGTVQQQPTGMTQTTAGGGGGGGGGGSGLGPNGMPLFSNLPPSSGAKMEAWLRVGDLMGSATNSAFRGWMDVSHYSFSIEASPGNKRADIIPLVVTKQIDASSPLLRRACCKGEVFKEVDLVVRMGGAIITSTRMMTARIVAIEGEALDDSGLPVEVLTFSCEQIRWEAAETLPNGAIGPAIPAGWDINANKEF